MNRDPLLLRALRGEPIERFPVWMMRQAGRYLPEYRAVKERYGFSTICLTPELSVEVALQPLRAFGFDAAILFSDIMIPARALGFDVEFSPGPVVRNPISTVTQIGNLSSEPDLSTLTPVFESLSMLRAELSHEALIGFAATPWTLACYLLDQRPFKHFERSTVWAYREPDNLKLLLNRLADLTEKYVVRQVEAGAQVIQLFDSWGGILPPDIYEEFSLSFANRIFLRLRALNVPSILYINGIAPFLEILGRVEADALSVDSKVSLSELGELVPTKTLQGNLDSAALFSNHVEVKTKRMLKQLSRSTRYIANLGHGVLQETPPDGVRAFVDAVKSYSL